MFSNYLRKDRQTNTSIAMGFSNYTKPNYTTNNIVLPSTQTTLNVIEPSDSAKMTWGSPTWYFLHTLAEKIDEDKFQEIKSGLLTIIFMVVSNLPCPICSNHGKDFLNSVNFNTIENKDDLKLLLFNFHNLVNSRKHYAIFTVDQLNEKYSSAITRNIFQNFMIHFTKKSGNIRLIADDLHRQSMISSIKQFLNINIASFAQ